jgi:hypothetical protein
MSAEAERARDLITEANKQTDVEEAAVHISEAQVHATLALVEQQRIANLIELARFSHTTASGETLTTNMNGATNWRDQAAEALGLS